MPLTVTTGDLFASGAQTLVNTVNTVGVMGKGIALEFKNRFPEVFKDYEARCQRHEVRLGEPYLYRRGTEPWVLNFPTKRHWRDVSRLSDIERGLDYLEAHYQRWGITSLAVPPLGCGNGQLEWRVVGPTLARRLARFEIPVTLFGPHGTPQAELSPTFLLDAEGGGPTRSGLPWMNPGWVALAAIVKRVQSEPIHWPVGRTRFQKIAYFATSRGVDTGLKFGRGSYGPFSPDLKQATSKLVNNGIIRESAGVHMIYVTPGPTFEDAALEYADALARWDDVIRDVADLFQRMDTRATEVAASALLVAKELEDEGRDYSELDIVSGVLDWKVRRDPPIDELQLAQAVRDLNLLGWLHATPSADLPIPEEV
jgi:uncharacterized protein YwgA/O-acetyl-ADP-ribose deacetylase (regulator of RNase III)